LAGDPGLPTETASPYDRRAPKAALDHRPDVDLMIATVFGRAADRLLVVDPGLARLATALRATLATFLTACLCLEFAAWRGAPLTVAGLGVLFSMIAPLFLRDATPRGWLTSLLTLYAVAVSCFLAAAALDPWPFAADAAFVAVLFAGMLVQACGPRALGCALAGLVSFYLGMYLRPSAGAAALTVALSAAAPCVVAAVGCWLVPQRQGAALRLAIRTVTLRARRVLHAARPGTKRAGDIHAALSAMNEAALAFEERLVLLDADDSGVLREALIELEIAAGAYVFAATDAHAREAAFRSAIATLASIDVGRARTASRTTLAASWTRWREALSWWPAARTAAAATLAMAAGHLFSSERWFWAVLTTFVVFLGTRSRGDTLHRAMQRIAGTLAGGLVSALAVTWLGGDPYAIACAMLLCVFGWAYFIMSAYGPGVFCITVLVSLVYGELGHAVQPLVELRIGEVAIGCVASLIAAYTIKPLDTTRHIEARFVEVVDALIEGVRMASMSADDAGDARRAAAVRALDRRWHDFRIALRPQRVFVWEPRYEYVAGALLCCVHHVRAMLLARDSRRIGEDRRDDADALIARLNAVRAAVGAAYPVEEAGAAGTGVFAPLDHAVSLLAQRIGERRRKRVFLTARAA
jgi:hypothetical protein